MQLTHEQLVERITKRLLSWEGEDLAKLCNENVFIGPEYGSRVEYVGDSLYELKWKLAPNLKLAVLSGETLVDASLLSEDEGLMRLIQSNAPMADCMKWINDHF